MGMVPEVDDQFRLLVGGDVVNPFGWIEPILDPTGGDTPSIRNNGERH
jgi:hypothetical protein